jgi:hypothetical protein
MSPVRFRLFAGFDAMARDNCGFRYVSAWIFWVQSKMEEILRIMAPISNDLRTSRALAGLRRVARAEVARQFDCDCS